MFKVCIPEDVCETSGMFVKNQGGNVLLDRKKQSARLILFYNDGFIIMF